MCACSRKQFIYRHVSLRPSAEMAVLEYSKDSPDSQGKELLQGKKGLSLKSKIEGSGYTVEIYTPLGSQPLAFAIARSSEGGELKMEGIDVTELNADSGVRKASGYRYELRVSDNPHGIWKISITNGTTTVGAHQVGYDVVTRGHKFETDTW